MLSASSSVSPKTTVTKLSARCARTAPPVAVVATKSSCAAELHAVLPARQARVFAAVVESTRCCRRSRRRARRASDAARQSGFTARSVYGAGAADRRDWLSSAPWPTPTQRLERYARLAVQVGLNLQPGQTLGDQRADRARAARARDRARGVCGRRALRRRPLLRPARAPRAHRAAPTTTSSATRRRGSSSGSTQLGEQRRRAAARSPATPSPSSSPTSTASASARRACARSPRRR